MRSPRSGPGPAVKLYVCGPTPMMRAVATIADFHGQPCDVSLEQVMGCGLGGCYSCVVLTRQVGAPPHFVRSCLEGPGLRRRPHRLGGVGALRHGA